MTDQAKPAAAMRKSRREGSGAGISRFLARAAAAVVGGYGGAYSLVWALSLWSPFDRASTTFGVGGLALLPYAALALWAFAASSLARAILPSMVVIAASAVAILLHGQAG